MNAVARLRQPLFSDEHSEARSREVLTAWAEQEVKPLRSDSLCGDLSGPCPGRGVSWVWGMDKPANRLWAQKCPEAAVGLPKPLSARWHLPG